jgi:hypothetical protein
LMSPRRVRPSGMRLREPVSVVNVRFKKNYHYLKVQFTYLQREDKQPLSLYLRTHRY